MAPLLMIAAVLSWLAALALLAFQTYAWARYGTWAGYKTIELVAFLGADKWAVQPTDWLGVHAFLMWLPLPGFFFALGLLLAWATAASDP